MSPLRFHWNDTIRSCVSARVNCHFGRWAIFQFPFVASSPVIVNRQLIAELLIAHSSPSTHKVTNDDVVVAVAAADATANIRINKEELINVMMERLHNGYDTRVSMLK